MTARFTATPRRASAGFPARALSWLWSSRLGLYGMMAATVPMFVLIRQGTIVLAIALLVVLAMDIVGRLDRWAFRDHLMAVWRASWPMYSSLLLAGIVVAPMAVDPIDHAQSAARVLLCMAGAGLLFAYGAALGRGRPDIALRFTEAHHASALVTLLIISAEIQFSGVLTGEDIVKNFEFVDFRWNKMVTALVLFTMPILYFWRRSGHTMFLIGTLIVYCIVFIVTPSEVARLLMLLTPLVFFPSRWLRVMSLLAIIGFVTLALIGPFLWPSLRDWWQTSELMAFKPMTTYARLAIWDTISGLVMAKPLFGHGIDATRIVGAEAQLNLPGVPTFGIWHPHNGGLQVAFDLGLVGVAAVSVMLIRLWQVIGRLPADAAAQVDLTIVAALVAVSVGFGLWQFWFWCLLAIMAFIAGIRLAGGPASAGEALSPSG